MPWHPRHPQGQQACHSSDLPVFMSVLKGGMPETFRDPFMVFVSPTLTKTHPFFSRHSDWRVKMLIMFNLQLWARYVQIVRAILSPFIDGDDSLKIRRGYSQTALTCFWFFWAPSPYVDIFYAIHKRWQKVTIFQLPTHLFLSTYVVCEKPQH